MTGGPKDGGGRVRNGLRWCRWATAAAIVAAGVTLPQAAGAAPDGARSAAHRFGSAGAYWMVTADGAVYGMGDAPYHGGLGQLDPTRPPGGANAVHDTDVVGMAPAPGAASSAEGGGYWLATSTGSVFAFGAARYFGSLGQLDPGHPPGGANATPVGGAGSAVMGIASTPDGGGYWLVTVAGWVYAFGDARYLGGIGQLDPGHPPGGTNAVPVGGAGNIVVGIASTPDGGGYWLVTSAGSVYAFGDAPYLGGLGQLDPGRPPGGTNAAAGPVFVAGTMPTPDGGGYWLVTSAGAVYAFGDAPYLGAPNQLQPTGAPATRAPTAGLSPVSAMVPTPDGGGYWLIRFDGSVYAYGDAPYLGGFNQLLPTFPPGGINALRPTYAVTGAAATG